MERILAFGTHPDDIEFMCGGTLALLAKAGHEIHMAVMAGGEMGSPTLPAPAIREKRLAEARAAADILGATFHFAGGHDIEVQYDSEYRRRTIRVVREADPTVILCPPPIDYLIDHEETSRLVRNAAFIAPCPNFDCGVPTTPTAKIAYLYYWNAVGLKDIFGRPLPLTCAIDIGEVLDVKQRMLACHESQREWLKFINGWDEYLEIMKRGAAEEGARAGRAAAEGFIRHVGNGHPTDDILARLLAGRHIAYRQEQGN
jgi:LmbE family N-acetylglucosaminyl deacetylase